MDAVTGRVAAQKRIATRSNPLGFNLKIWRGKPGESFVSVVAFDEHGLRFGKRRLFRLREQFTSRSIGWYKFADLRPMFRRRLFGDRPIGALTSRIVLRDDHRFIGGIYPQLMSAPLQISIGRPRPTLSRQIFTPVIGAIGSAIVKNLQPKTLQFLPAVV